MKTIIKILELSLKKEVIIIEPDKIENTDAWIKIYSEYGNFICKGSELTEEIASELVDEIGDTLTKENLIENFNSISTFIHLIKSKGFYWLENPISRPRNYELWAKYGDYTQYGIVLTEKCLKWQEAEEKTFKNPLIFVKK